MLRVYNLYVCHIFPSQAIYSQDTEAIESSYIIYAPPRLKAHRLLKIAVLQNHISKDYRYNRLILTTMSQWMLADSRYLISLQTNSQYH